jgi:hypothetical protein
LAFTQGETVKKWARAGLFTEQIEQSGWGQRQSKQHVFCVPSELFNNNKGTEKRIEGMDNMCNIGAISDPLVEFYCLMSVVNFCN